MCVCVCIRETRRHRRRSGLHPGSFPFESRSKNGQLRRARIVGRKRRGARHSGAGVFGGIFFLLSFLISLCRLRHPPQSLWSVSYIFWQCLKKTQQGEKRPQQQDSARFSVFWWQTNNQPPPLLLYRFHPAELTNRTFFFFFSLVQQKTKGIDESLIISFLPQPNRVGGGGFGYMKMTRLLCTPVCGLVPSGDRAGGDIIIMRETWRDSRKNSNLTAV